METKNVQFNARTAFVAVDPQNGFGARAQSDKLRTLKPSEAQEVKNLSRLAEACYQAGGTVVLTADWHPKLGTVRPDGVVDNRSRAEFDIYDEHCVEGSRDAEFNNGLEHTLQQLEAASGQKRTIIPVDDYDDTGHVGDPRLIVVHKSGYDWSKYVAPNGEVGRSDAVAQTLSALVGRGIDTAVFAGKIAEVCVKQSLEGAREMQPQLKTAAVRDAISSLPDDIAQTLGLQTKGQVMAEMKQQGVRVVQTADLLPRHRSYAADSVPAL